jgi:protein involved in polysaccharide export with SLBB domain
LQLKRQGQTVAEFDLYNFLGNGDKSSDVKLQDGDVLFYPRAAGYMALLGKLNTQAVFEVKSDKDTLAEFISLAGGLPVTADPRRATLDRIQPGSDQPRSIQDLSLADAGQQTQVKNGDVLTVAVIVPELANAVTLRGAVAQAAQRHASPFDKLLASFVKGLLSRDAAKRLGSQAGAAGTQFTCFTSTKVQILTRLRRRQGGNSRTAIICTVTPAAHHFGESMNTLKVTLL